MDVVLRLLDEALAARLGSAAAVSIGDAGIEVFRASRGLDRHGGAPIDERSRFDLASVTKPMATGSLAMTLVADGRLELDAPLARWFPGRAGTVLHLLGHAAGCAAHREFWHQPLDRARVVELAAADPAGPPGASAVYSDLGYILLGAVLERVAGVPLEDAVARVMERLGISARYGPSTHAVATEGDICGVVHDENARFSGGVCGHAGLFGTIGDVAAYARALVTGAFVPEMFARFATMAAAPDTSLRLSWDTPSSTPGVSHAGEKWPRAHAVGHLGFTGTSLWLDLPRERWVVLLTNRVHPTRVGSDAGIKALRRAVADAAVTELDAR